MAAKSGTFPRTIAANGGKFIAAICRNLPRAVRPGFFLPVSEGDGV
jgi:hypothetical protein